MCCMHIFRRVFQAIGTAQDSFFYPPVLRIIYHCAVILPIRCFAVIFHTIKRCLSFLNLHSGSQVLSGLLGGEAGDMVRALAFQDLRPTYPKTMGGRVWWRFVETVGPYTVQQNILSQHYRALDREDGRVCSSFDLEEVRQRLRELEGRR